VRSRGAIVALLVVSLGLLNATGSYGDYALIGKCEAAHLENSTVLDTVEFTPPRPTPVLVYTNPAEEVHLSRTCKSSLGAVARSLSGITPFVLYGTLTTARGTPSSTPEGLPELPSGDGPQEVLLVRSASPRSTWEIAAVHALTGNQPERVIDRSVRSVGSPAGLVEVVRLVIA
jgi:hypothetical protein